MTTERTAKIRRALTRAAQASTEALPDLREALEVIAAYHLAGPQAFVLLPDLSDYIARNQDVIAPLVVEALRARVTR